MISKELMEIVISCGLRELSLNISQDRLREMVQDMNTFLSAELAYSISARDKENLADSISMALICGLPHDYSVALCQIMKDEWHLSHEDIVTIIEIQKYIEGVDCLYDAAIREYPYPISDEFSALGIKCVYALKTLGTAAAREKLLLLAKVDNQRVAKAAQKNLGNQYG